MARGHRSEYGVQPLVDIAGGRLREAREAKGFSLATLARKVRISRGQLNNYENRHPGALRTRESILQALARQLGVREAWLRGEDAIPIDVYGWRVVPAKLLAETPKALGSSRLSVRRWMFVGRCLQAARRDYQRLEGRRPQGDEWRQIEWQLVSRFLALPTFGSLALKAVTLLTTDVRGTTVPSAEEPTRALRWWQEWNDHAVTFWETFLEPWFAGTKGFNYQVLIGHSEGTIIRHDPGSPREILVSPR
jgi:Predicted transcriptional regulators